MSATCVLLVEDNPQNRYLVTFLLEKHGFRVEAAVDGTHALQRAREVGPDLILLDLQLPGLDGYAVARALRREAQFERVPVVALTAYAMAGDRDKALAAGCDGYIEKPIDVAAFVAQVEAFLYAGAAPPGTPADAADATAAAPPAPLHGEGGGPVVLVVDDRDTNRELLRLMLVAAGYRVRLASDGAMAWQTVAQAGCDLVLSDLHMGGEDGLRLLRRVKDDARSAHLPFVFISSTSPRREERDAAFAGGAAAFLERPIEGEALQRELQRLLAPRSPEAADGA